jgi:hypothetical protein
LCLGVFRPVIIPFTPPPVLGGGVSVWERVDVLSGLTGVVGLVLVRSPGASSYGCLMRCETFGFSGE